MASWQVEPRCFDPWGELETWRGQLPHWKQAGSTYFITWRLVDAIPAERLREWYLEREAWLGARPRPLSSEDEQAYHRLFPARIDLWLDAGSGACCLRNGEMRDLVSSALRHFDGERYHLHCFVVMPNHVHLLVSLNVGTELSAAIHSWKSFTANAINRVLGLEGAVWQKEYFDRLIRDREHFGNCVRYIRRNPEKARLGRAEFTLYESELVRSIE